MRLLFGLLVVILNSSCGNSTPFEVKEFVALGNYSKDDSIKYVNLDYDGSFENGFVIPSIKQTSDGFFEASFELRNDQKNGKHFFYKLYYQNESYKFDEDHAYSSSPP